MTATRVALVGVGAMGEAILAALLRGGYAPDAIVVVERRPARSAELRQRYSVEPTGDIAAAGEADIVLLAVKPADIGSVLHALAPSLRASTVVVSVAAGVTVRALEATLPAGTATVRAMPNTPALVGQGMTALSPGTHCGDEAIETARRVLALTGQAIIVPESVQDAVTAVSGSGPAYVFYLAEAMIEAGVSLGLTRDVAAQLVRQTLLGASMMLTETGEQPGLLRERVSSPGGTTVAALGELDDRGVRAAMVAAMRAARDRSRELAGPDAAPS